MLALPVGPAISTRVISPEGVRPEIHVHVYPATVGFLVEPDMALMAVDDVGRWTVGRYADGSYFRRRA